MPLDPDVVTEGLGAFDEIEELGHGTFGTTFRVVRDDDVYAVKVIHLEGMPSYLWRREITALSAVDHPNVVGFRDADVFEVDGREYPFIECEFIDGGNIQQNLAGVGAQATPTRCALYLLACLPGSPRFTTSASSTATSSPRTLRYGRATGGSQCCSISGWRRSPR